MGTPDAFYVASTCHMLLSHRCKNRTRQNGVSVCACVHVGMVERVNRELVEDPAICGGQKVRLLAVPGSSERRYSTWVGGSILSSLSSFQAAWCSREEYEEHGPAVVQRKCY